MNPATCTTCGRTFGFRPTHWDRTGLQTRCVAYDPTKVDGKCGGRAVGYRPPMADPRMAEMMARRPDNGYTGD